MALVHLMARVRVDMMEVLLRPSLDGMLLQRMAAMDRAMADMALARMEAMT